MRNVPDGLRDAAASEIPVRKIKRGEALEALAHELVTAEVTLQARGVSHVAHKALRRQDLTASSGTIGEMRADADVAGGIEASRCVVEVRTSCG